MDRITDDRNKILKKVTSDPRARRELCYRSHWYFFKTYFAKYAKYPSAPFHREMFDITEDENTQQAVIVAFRGSAKSTIMSFSYPLWAILGRLNKKFVVISSQTQQQSKLILANIRHELETNTPLINDFGPFYEDAGEWSANSLVLPQFDCRITAVSSGESIRGIKHHENRPDLIICDDVEDLDSVKTREGRDKTYQWLNGEVIPAGDRNTKLIVIGNLLHEDSLVMRLKSEIEEGKLKAIYKVYPLLDGNDLPLWSGKFPTEKDIAELKQRTGSESAWQREYMLKIIPDQDQVVRKEWIHYYDSFPDEGCKYIATGIDLAISLESSADFTAMVSGRVYGYLDKMKIFLLPNPVNERMDFPNAIERAKLVSISVGGGSRTRIAVEDVGYQRSFIQHLNTEGYTAESVKISGQEKRARLISITALIQSGSILFPKFGAEQLIQQLVGFGVEKHDDLADALVILAMHSMQNNKGEPSVRWL